MTGSTIQRGNVWICTALTAALQDPVWIFELFFEEGAISLCPQTNANNLRAGVSFYFRAKMSSLMSQFQAADEEAPVFRQVSVYADLRRSHQMLSQMVQLVSDT